MLLQCHYGTHATSHAIVVKVIKTATSGFMTEEYHVVEIVTFGNLFVAECLAQ